MTALERQRHLLARLAEPSRFPHSAEAVERIETHISTLLLAGEHAYKIKKPLDLGFLDFSTLESRRRCCEAELEINRALAPGIYLDVATIRGTPDDPNIGGEGPVLEYAVHMRRFDRDQELDRLLDSGRLPVSAMDELGAKVAAFHEQADRAPADSEYGTPQAVLAPMLANFEALEPAADAAPGRSGQLHELESWTRQTCARLESLIRSRLANGFVRACHGDMHLGNMVYVRDDQGRKRLAIFDGIEFNASLRWIDVASELAFMTMDLHARGAPAHAHRVLNAYLEWRDDLEALSLLPFYQVYRALVRAKVNAIHAAEAEISDEQRAECDAEVERYLKLASRLRLPGQPGLILMHGISGSGKTWISTAILERLGAIRLRSDVERKRMIGLAPDDRPTPEQQEAMYSPEGIDAVYRHLQGLAGRLLAGGHLVIVDATFMKREQRRPFQDLARDRDAGFAIVHCSADIETLRERLVERRRSSGDASDADIEVMEQQRAAVEPPGEDEPSLHTGPGNPLRWPALEEMLGRGSRSEGVSG
ncbi:AAA family ATPase [Thioalkalivibrio sp.]|uniref:bifunctional aminoglycoside phosphotransferase/ATP-binding protein n=1 Tax=Thioalkalivibrio sp. TaxID=2093813 RepID=UPI003565F2B3